MEGQKEWFESWFDSPYYHSLYKHRDAAEAELFLSTLIERLGMDTRGTLLDIACGKGRHSVYLNSRGFDVTGFDISPRSISHNKQFENHRLHFFIHDMRLPFRKEAFDYALNLFSSFGYFDNDTENQAALDSAADSLKPGGTFTFDYANMDWVLRSALESSEEIHDGIRFRISKSSTEKFVTKKIEFTAEGKDYCFEERLRVLFADDLERMIVSTGLTVVHRFGDYALNPFDTSNSKRIVIVAVKK